MNQIKQLSLSIILFLGVSIGLLAQEPKVELDSPIPIDPNVRVGKLDNGMTYYIRKNATPEKRAHLTLAVGAGSVLEDESQRGLAHFCEHMAFNGTKNFPKHELIEYLESIGMKFGADVNAYTSFDETVYGIEVPTDNIEFLDKGLLVLNDWAFNISFEDEEIDKERGVIHEEWRGNQNAQFRMLEKTLPVLFNGSKYAERLPIGLMSVVDSCDYDELRNFYKDWYRPDLMAVIAVGDFDPDHVEAKIKEMFSKGEMPKNPRPKVTPEIPDHKEPKVSVASDEEAPQASIQMYYKHPLWIKTKVSDYKREIATNLFNDMIGNRLNEKLSQDNPPYVYAYAGYSPFLGPKHIYMSIAATKNDQIKTGFDALLVENERAKRHGFVQTELERAKSSLLKKVEKMYNERNKRKSGKYIEEYKSNFLMQKEPIPGIEYEYKIYKQLVPEIKLDDVNNLAKEFITDENLVVLVNAPKKEDVVLPKEEELLKMINEVKNKDIKPYVDKVSDKPLIAKMPEPGKIVKEDMDKNVNVEHIQFDNGVNVYIKKTDFKDDEIKMTAYSKGGSSLVRDQYATTIDIATDVLSESGLGDYDKIELEKYLSDKTVRLSPYIGEYTEGFNGSSSVDDFETLLKLTYLHFTKPRFDETAFNSYISRTKAMLENKNANPDQVFRDSAMWAMVDYHPRRKPMDVADLDALTEKEFKRMSYEFGRRFGDPGNFTFFFVGNISKEEVKPLLEKYLGGLPKVDRTETYKDLGIRPPKGVVKKEVFKGQADKSTVLMSFTGKMDFTPQQRLNLDAVCTILSTKLLENIREEQSGVYSIGAYPSYKKIPEAQYSIVVYFGCAPDNVDNLTKSVIEEMNKLKKDGPGEEDLAKVIEKKKRERETNIQENKYWINALKNYHSFGEDFNVINKYDDLVKNITKDSMKKAANTYFNESNYVQVVLKPEKQ